MQEACLKRVTSGCSRLAQSWSDLLSGADVFDGLSVILVRTNERTRFAGARCARSRWRRWSDEV